MTVGASPTEELDKDAIFLEHDTWNHSSPDSPPTRMTQASSVFFGNQDYSRDNNFLKPLASTPGNGKTLPLGEFDPFLMRTYVASMCIISPIPIAPTLIFNLILFPG